jgi:DNA-binding transcriptional MerR regulator
MVGERIMTEYRIRYAMIGRKSAEPLYSPRTAADLAGISLQTLERYRQQELIRPRSTASGEPGYSRTDVYEISCIARLQEEVEFDLDTIEVVLHLRSQVFAVQQEMEALRQLFLQREQELLETIHELRGTLATEARWG